MRHSPLSLAGRRLVAGLALLLVGSLVALDSDRGAAQTELTGARAADGAASTGGAPEGATPSAGDADGAEAAPDAAAEHDAGAAAQDDARVHVVAPGETPGAIAEQHGVRTSALTRANRHARAEALQPGMTLVVPDPQAPRLRTPQDAMAADLDLERLFEEVAEAYGWNPATVKAVAWVESRWDQHVISNREAIGVMQVQQPTGDLMAERVGRPLDLHDVRDNIEAGVAYLDYLHGRYGSDTRALLAAYHQGPQAVRDHGIYRISHRYADDILRLREVFRAGPAG